MYTVRCVSLVVLVALAGCAIDPDAPSPLDEPEPIALSPQRVAFVRVLPSGAIIRRSGGAGAATVTAGGSGTYTVTFPGFGTTSAVSGAGGNVHVVSEGVDNRRCRVTSWGGTSALTIGVRCTTPNGVPQNTAFSVLFTRELSPTTTSMSATTGYAWVTASGTAPSQYNFNSSGVANLVRHDAPGYYLVGFRNLVGLAEETRFDPMRPLLSLAISNYGGVDPGTMCTLDWFTDSMTDFGVPGTTATVECRNKFGDLTEGAFTISVSRSGIPSGHQTASHYPGVYYNDYGAYPVIYGRNGVCSEGHADATKSGGLGFVTVGGDFGRFSPSDPVAQPFLIPMPNATSFVRPAYCKVENDDSSGADYAATVHCYRASGFGADPYFAFTRILDVAAAPESGCE